MTDERRESGEPPRGAGDAASLDGFVVAGDGERAVRLSVGPDALVVREADGAERTLPWRGAKLARRASDGALLVQRRGLTAGSRSPEFLRVIESVAGNELGTEIARLGAEPGGGCGSGWIGCVVFFVVLGGILWSIPACIRKGVDSAVDSAPFSVDVTIGKAAEDSMAVGSLVEDEIVTGAVGAIVDRLARAAGEVRPSPEIEWSVRIVHDDTINAFALPGGYITVFSGLIEAAESPEMVAGVLAHEMAHVTERHGLRRVGRALGFFAALQLILGDATGLAGIAKEVLGIASVNAYSREQENEADVVGTRFLHRAEIDPAALGAFFALLAAESGDVPSAMAWLSTHPQLEARTRAITLESARLGPVEWRPIEVDWEAVRERL